MWFSEKSGNSIGNEETMYILMCVYGLRALFVYLFEKVHKIRKSGDTCVIWKQLLSSCHVDNYACIPIY